MGKVDAPTRPTDDMYEYKFERWEPMISDEQNVLKYRARYKYTPIEYIVRYFVDGKPFATDSCDYGANVPLPSTNKQGYLFSGWFIDEGYTQRLSSAKMDANPEHTWNLYGYYTLNVREENAPEITLSVVERTDNLVTIDAKFTANISGVAAMSLNLVYDRANLVFKGFKLGDAFSQNDFMFKPSANVALGEDGYYRATANGALVGDPFTFMFNNGLENTMSLGLIVRLQFEVADNAPIGVYTVSFDYDKTKDVSYWDENGEPALTALNIVPAQISQGEKKQWNEAVEGDSSVTVDVTSSVGMEMYTILRVNDVSASFPSENYTSVIGNGKEIKNAYRLDLLQNNVSVQPGGELQVKIKLKADALNNAPTLYFVGANNELTLIEATVVDGELVFSTDNLGTFVIVGNKAQSPQTPDDNNPPSKGERDNFWLFYLMVILGIVGLIVELIYVVVVRRRRREQSRNDPYGKR